MIKIKHFLTIILMFNTILLILLSIKHIELLDNPKTDTILSHSFITLHDTIWPEQAQGECYDGEFYLAAEY